MVGSSLHNYRRVSPPVLLLVTAKQTVAACTKQRPLEHCTCPSAGVDSGNPYLLPRNVTHICFWARLTYVAQQDAARPVTTFPLEIPSIKLTGFARSFSLFWIAD